MQIKRIQETIKGILPTKLSIEDYNAFVILTKLEYEAGFLRHIYNVYYSMNNCKTTHKKKDKKHFLFLNMMCFQILKTTNRN